MNFIIKDKDGSLQGPIDQETLRKWVDIDKVRSDTPVRNSLVQNWKTAEDFDFLEDALEAQGLRAKAQAEVKKGFFSKILEGPEKSAPRIPKEVSSAFKYEYIPKPAGVALRLCAAAFDWLLIGIFAFCLLITGMTLVYFKALNDTMPGDKMPAAIAKETAAPKPQDTVTDSRPPTRADNASNGFHLGSLWTDSSNDTVYACINSDQDRALWCKQSYMNACFFNLYKIFLFTTLLYLGFSLAFFAQTFGMWFWGVFIVRSDNGEAVYPLRAFAFIVLSLPLGFMMPVVSAVVPNKRSLHDMITGVRLIGISAKPKT